MMSVAALETLSLSELLALQGQVATQIAAARAAQENEIINELRQKAAQLGLSADELVARLNTRPGAKRTVAAQFRDPASGTEWSGRGRKPLWVVAWLNAGRSVDELRIK